MIGACDVCNFDGIVVKEYQRALHRQPRNEAEPRLRWNLCEICAGSFISRSVDHSLPESWLAESLGYCTNAILAAIKAK